MLAGSTNTAHPVVLHVAGVSGCPDLCAHGPCAPCFDLQDNMPLTVLAPPDFHPRPVISPESSSALVPEWRLVFDVTSNSWRGGKKAERSGVVEVAGLESVGVRGSGSSFTLNTTVVIGNMLASSSEIMYEARYNTVSPPVFSEPRKDQVAMSGLQWP
ncbi:hypothetical protein RRG08_002742 [Elysia crispata]|uniref:Uncharacterized protein n=1 Tax=Elysia crispata TaxID=231223 RepID=A0AAE0XTV0_9GAST|nr:hypothetical protein RRG08_002742 [Elysia crispata]